MILGLGLVAFMFDTVGGVLFAKFLNLFLQEEDQPHDRRGGHLGLPHVGARGRTRWVWRRIHQNFLLMHAVGVNVSGQIASVIAGGLILNMLG